MQRLAVAFAFADFFAFLDFFEADPWARGIFILVHFSFVQSHNANDGRQRQINCMKKKKKKKKKKLRCTGCGGSEVLEGIQDGTVAIGPVGLYRWFYVILSYFFSPQK